MLLVQLLVVAAALQPSTPQGVSLRGAEGSTMVEAASEGDLRKILSLLGSARPGLWTRTQWLLIGGLILVGVGFGLVHCLGNMNGDHMTDAVTDCGVTSVLCTIGLVAICGVGAVILLGYHVMPSVSFAQGAGACLFLLTVVFFGFGVYFGTMKLREYHDPPHGASHFHRLPQNYFIGSDPRLREISRDTYGSGRVGGMNLDGEVVEGLQNATYTTRY
jgi:hypothetical protein